MILDTSAIVAIFNGEPEREQFEAIIATNECKLSTISYLEVSIVLRAKRGNEAIAELDAWIETADIELIPFTATQARLARRAYLAYGKGRHKAGLNFGDCATYGLAADFSEPLLHKGNDFDQTNLRISS